MSLDALRSTARAMPWLPAVVAAIVSIAVTIARHGRASVFVIQVISIALASGLGFTFDDPAFEVAAPAPTALLRRRLQRLLLVLPPTVLLWAALVGWQGTAGPEESWAVIALFAGLVGLSVGIAGLAARRSSRGRGGIVVAPAIFVALFLSTTIPPSWRPLPLGDVPGGWAQIYLRWTVAAIVGVLAFLVSSRDPARRRAMPRPIRAGRSPTGR